MPREVIATHGDLGEPIGVEVSWGREGFVQVATTNLDKEQFEMSRGWFVTLNRNEINRLIRFLRKARDQAYGADE